MVNKTRKRVRRQIRNKKLDKRLNVREIMHQKMMQNLLLTQPQQQQSNQLGLNIAQQELYNKERIVSDLNNKIEANKQEIKRKDEERKTYLETIKNQEIFISNMNRDTKKAEKSLKQQIAADEHAADVAEELHVIKSKQYRYNQETDEFADRTKIESEKQRARDLEVQSEQAKAKLNKNIVYNEYKTLKQRNDVQTQELNALKEVLASNEFTKANDAYKKAYIEKLLNEHNLELLKLQYKHQNEYIRQKAELDAQQSYWDSKTEVITDENGKIIKISKGDKMQRDILYQLTKNIKENTIIQDKLDDYQTKQTLLQAYKDKKRDLVLQKQNLTVEQAYLSNLASQTGLQQVKIDEKTGEVILGENERKVLQQIARKEVQIEGNKRKLAEKQRNRQLIYENAQLDAKIESLKDSYNQKQLDELKVLIAKNEQEEEKSKIMNKLYENTKVLKEIERSNAVKNAAISAEFPLTGGKFMDYGTIAKYGEAAIRQENAIHEREEELRRKLGIMELKTVYQTTLNICNML